MESAVGLTISDPVPTGLLENVWLTPGPVMVTVSESATFQPNGELPPNATQESAVKDKTLGHGGGTKTGLTATKAVLVIVCGEQPPLLTVKV